MKNAVIICEFNPLHIGHKRLLDSARTAGAENVICVMSGNAVQRGELACLDKYTRARHAVLAGADAVVELPAEYTLSAARQFALGGVKIANLVKDATLVFGSESGDIEKLERLAFLLSSPEVNEKIKSALSEGIGYPAAVAKASGESLIENSPNNTLGIEYIRAINDTGRKISAYTIKRDNSPCDSAPCGYPTSSSLRAALSNGESVNALMMPPFVLGDFEKHVPCDDQYYAVLRYSLLSENRKNVYDDTEGLMNRLVDCARKADNFRDFCSLAAAKRYTRARVKRLALNAVIGNTNTHTELTEKPVGFVNVLAMRKGKENLLSDIAVPAAVSGRSRAPFAEVFELTRRIDALFSSVRYSYKELSVFVDAD